MRSLPEPEYSDQLVRRIASRARQMNTIRFFGARARPGAIALFEAPQKKSRPQIESFPAERAAFWTTRRGVYTATLTPVLGGTVWYSLMSREYQWKDAFGILRCVG